jgi:hypothetical protein
VANRKPEAVAVLGGEPEPERAGQKFGGAFVPSFGQRDRMQASDGVFGRDRPVFPSGRRLGLGVGDQLQGQPVGIAHPKRLFVCSSRRGAHVDRVGLQVVSPPAQ